MAQRILEITLVSARDLKDVNLFSKMEVYAVVSISGDPRTRQRTPADRSGGRNPSWSATLRFAVPDARDLGGRDLHVLLRAERALGDRDIGEVRVPLKELLGGAAHGDGPRSPQFVSYHVRKAGSGKPRGVLNFSYKLAERIAAPEAADEPVTAYPVGSAAPYRPPPPYGYPAPPYPPPPYGYAAPPPQMAGYGYPPPPPGYAPPPQPSRRNNFGMGLGAGLLGGALGGLLIGDMISDNTAYDAGYDSGFGDAGGFDDGFGF